MNFAFAIFSRRRAAIFFAVMISAAGVFSTRATVLRCENLVNPEGIDAATPRLSWRSEATATDLRGERQAAYQILVASSAKNLAADRGDLWDSGKVISDQSTLVAYAGKTLASRAECFWKVRIWDAAGRVSPWSGAAHWTMGILNAADWHAQWIGQDGLDVSNFLAGTWWVWSPALPEKTDAAVTNWFRRVLTLPVDRRIKRAVFQYTGDNEGRGWLDRFDLGARNNVHTVKFNDITTRLKPGRSYVIGLVGRTSATNTHPGVVGLLTVEFETGEPLVIATDEGWKVSSREEKDWNTLAFDDSTWSAAKKIAAAGAPPWGETRTAENRRQPARYLRKEFSVAKKIQRATVSYSGLGLSELYLNGKKVGDEVLSPALAQYDKRVFYVTHDVTKQIKSGANALGVVLGGGRYYADRSKVYAGTMSFGWPKLLLNLRIEFTDGSVSEVVSDTSWKLSLDGPIRANSEYDGEEYDARNELGDWSKPQYNDAKWANAQTAVAPSGAVVATMAEPMRVTGTLKPVAITEPQPGVYIFDMGQNMVGWCRLHVCGAAGARVVLRHAETLKLDGTIYTANLRGARNTDSYTLRGGGTEIYEPRFSYRGFRFVEVTGFPGKPTLAALEGRVVNDDLPVAGNFLCSNDLLNRIYTNVVWGTRGNYRSVPTDCPQRDERQGWLGDRSEECRGESYLFDISKIYAKWLRDIGDAQKSSGSLPDVAPTSWPIYSDNVVWPSTLILAADVLERQYAEPSPVAGRYAAAQKWLNYMKGFFTNGIIAKDAYGDWCVPPEDLTLIHSKDPARQTDKALLATSYFFHDLKLMAKFAGQLGKTNDVTRYESWAEEVKTAFNDKFLIRETGRYDNGSQTSCVLPLAFGLVPDDMVETIFKQLVSKIENETHGHIGTGLVGGQYLMRVLTEHGRADLAYTIATQKEYPGWGYMLANGATTIWELWNGNTADPTMNSGNHVMLVGDLIIWFYENLAGIAADPAQPGFKHIVMQPTPVGDLNFVKASHNSPFGKITSEWKMSGGKFDWQIEIPANTTATIFVPAKDESAVAESGVSAATAPGVKFLRAENGRAIFEIGGGKYHFTSRP